MNQFLNTLYGTIPTEKLAAKRFRPVFGEIENELGLQALPKKYHAETKELIEKEVQNRPGLKHPILTGIPTMALWPLNSKQKATLRVARILMRRHPELAKSKALADALSHKRNTEYLQSTEKSRVAANYATGAVNVARAVAAGFGTRQG